MASLIFLLLLAFVLLFAGSEAQQRQSNISLGSSITPRDQNSSWLSNSGLYAFGFYKQGDGFSVGIFMAGIPQKTVVWTANRDSPPVTSNATLQFTSEGRFVLRSTTGEEQYIGDDQPASSASMLDSGNLVLYNSRGGIVWESFNYPTDTLLPTQRLRADTQLVSSASESDHSSGLFLLGMQPDGNLVQYPAKTLVTRATSDAYYASNTYLEGDNVSLVFDANIYLYLLNSTGVNIMNITNRQYLIEDGIYLMRIDVDGIFRLYSYSRRRSNSAWSIEWSSSNDKCSPRGLCGFNMYCVLNDQEADCKCLPGFDFVKKGNWSSGCERNFVANSCTDETSSLAFDIEEVPNTIWGVDYPFSIQQVQGKEGCIQACSDDCNCEAAFYKDGECRKQRLPLIYGHRTQVSDITLIKVSASTPLKDNCSPRGLCGFNMYCVLNDKEADCRCLPGFDFVKMGNWSTGCKRKFVAKNCADESGSLAYHIEEVPNTSWENYSYSIEPVLGKEGCIQACSDDCNCEAAFYKDRECRKQRLPLQYGRRLQDDTNIALIKVYASTPHVESEERIRKDILVISISLLSLGFVMLVISVVVLWRRNFFVYKKVNQRCQDVESTGNEVNLRSFTYEELEIITDGFKEEIGKGSFGTVYKGIILNSQKEVAVKKLEKLLEEGDREFQNEMKAIGRTHHKSLVQLPGYCHEGAKRLLVYEYMSNGSLADMLFNPENKPCWEERLGITCGIASGILYLHEECAMQIIHCDIKPQNILIDQNRRAKISDFGLAKLLKPDQTKTFTGIRGTRGYVAPEWHRNVPITTKVDVYSFGIVMLEIICRRRNLNWNLPEKEAVLEEWVYDCFERGELLKLVGSEEIDMKQLEKMVKVALWCIQDEPSIRPSMKKVLLMLEGTVEIPIPPNPEFFSTQVLS